MVILRAWMRRHVGHPPSEAIALETGFEASHLASHVRQADRWMIHVGTYQNPEDVQPAAQKLVDGSPNAAEDISRENLRLFPGNVNLDELAEVVDLSRTTEPDAAFKGVPWYIGC